MPASADLGQVEDVAFGVGEGDPVGAVLVVLVEPLGAQSDQAVDLGGPVGGGQVDVQAVLAVARLGKVSGSRKSF